MWSHEMTYRAGPWSRERRVALVVLERPDELLLDHFWPLTSLDARGRSPRPRCSTSTANVGRRRATWAN